MTAHVFDARVCALGEGPLWHPTRKQLFWFDILGKKMLSQQDGAPIEWTFDEHVSAAGWVDHDTLLIASATGLWQFDVKSEQRSLVVALEADQPLTRSNDGRADPWGGFWIGTMGLNAEPGLGAIYRYYKGELRRLVEGITVPNSIAFSPDKKGAYFTDTLSRKIMYVSLSSEDGWLVDTPQIFVDLTQEKLNPDGSVVDQDGCLWNAQWEAGQVRRYGPDGVQISTHSFSATQTTCPAFGDDDLSTLYVTSAAHGGAGALKGQTFQIEIDVQGQPEHRVIL